MVLKRAVKNIKKGTQSLLDKTTVDDKLFASAKKIKKEVRKHIITAITAAFGFLIALAWRDAIASWINTLIENFSLSEGWYKFIAAILITIIGVVGIILVSRFEQKEIK